MTDWMDDYQLRLEERTRMQSPSAQRRREVIAQEELAAQKPDRVPVSPLIEEPPFFVDGDVPNPEYIRAKEAGLVDEKKPSLLDKLRQPAKDFVSGVGEAAMDVARPIVEPFLPGSPTDNPIARGVATAPQNVLGQALQIADEVLTTLGDKPININPEDYKLLPEGNSLPESMARGIAQFMIGFKGAGGFSEGATYGSRMASGALADMLFDPAQGNFSTFLKSLNVNNELIDWMGATPGEDAPAEERLMFRLKTALEGAGLGLATDGVLQGLKYIKAHKQEIGDALAQVTGTMEPPPGSAYEQLGLKAGFAGQRGSIAFHASPKKYTQPNLNAVGSGEGGAAYGHGYYSAQNPEVSKEYLSMFDDGYHYKVDIPDEDVGKYLDWDKPFSGQSKEVKKVLAPVVRDLHLDSDSGAAIYKHLSAMEGGDEAASKYLDSIGIRGNKYLDEGSRGFVDPKYGDQTYNYVTFDPSRITPLERSGTKLPPKTVSQAYGEVVGTKILRGMTRSEWDSQIKNLPKTAQKQADELWLAGEEYAAKAGSAPGAGPVDAPVDAAERLQRMLGRDKTKITALKNENTVLRGGVGAEHAEVVVGAPTPKQWINRVEQTLDDSDIDAAANWYSEVHKAFEVFPEKDRDKWVAAWLASNKNETPEGALRNALRVAEDIKAGVVGGKKGGLSHDALVELFSTGKLSGKGMGVKLYDFTDSALQRATRSFMGDAPSGGGPFVIDVHSSRDLGLVDEPYMNWLRQEFGADQIKKAGIKLDTKSTISETQYELLAERGRELTDELNRMGWRGRSDWKPWEVQAIGWTAMARKMGRKGFSPQEAIEANMRHVPFEVAPGEGSALDKAVPGFSALPDAEKVRVTQAISKKAFDYAADIAGIQLGDTSSGYGGWMEYFTPNSSANILATKEGAERVGAALAHILDQDEVWVPSISKSGKHSAVAIFDNTGQLFSDPAKLKEFWGKLREAYPDAQGFSPTKHGDKNGIVLLFENPSIRKGASGKTVKIGKTIRDRELDEKLIPAISEVGKQMGLGDKALGVPGVYHADISMFGRNAIDEGGHHVSSGADYLERVLGEDGRAKLHHARKSIEQALKDEVERASQGQAIQ